MSYKDTNSDNRLQEIRKNILELKIIQLLLENRMYLSQNHIYWISGLRPSARVRFV